MKRILATHAWLPLFVPAALAQDDYRPGPESMRRLAVPESAPPRPPPAPCLSAAMCSHLAATYPHISEGATGGLHDDDSTVGQGCDDQFEFEFGLDVLLEGFERLHQQGWNSTDAGCGTSAAS